MLTVRAAHVIKSKLVDDEFERLTELRSVIAEYIRKADGSAQSRKDISAMTDAMSNATALLKYASKLSIYDFFHECPLKTCRI